MPRLIKILFPIDFSERCGRTAASVETLTKRLHAQLTLLNVPAIPALAPFLFSGPRHADLCTELRAASVNAMDRFVKRRFGSFPLRCAIEEGDPAQAIVEYAHRHKVDLIMVPTHGYGAFRRFLIGSVAAKILHDAHCPVWTSVHAPRHRQRPASAYRNILCGVDRHGDPVPLIRWAAWLAHRLHARLTLVHVVPALDETSRSRAEKEIRNFLTARAMEELTTLTGQAGFHGEVLIRGGSIPARLADTARQQRADLLVVGRGHMRNALGRLRTHSLALVRESPCPVVSV